MGGMSSRGDAGVEMSPEIEGQMLKVKQGPFP